MMVLPGSRDREEQSGGERKDSQSKKLNDKFTTLTGSLCTFSSLFNQFLLFFYVVCVFWASSFEARGWDLLG